LAGQSGLELASIGGFGVFDTRQAGTPVMG
jgi:hypothetical protein